MDLTDEGTAWPVSLCRPMGPGSPTGAAARRSGARRRRSGGVRGRHGAPAGRAGFRRTDRPTPHLAVRAPTAARERNGTVCFHSAGRKSLAAEITPADARYAHYGGSTPAMDGSPAGSRPHDQPDDAGKRPVGTHRRRARPAAKTVSTSTPASAGAFALSLAHDCEDALSRLRPRPQASSDVVLPPQRATSP